MSRQKDIQRDNKEDLQGIRFRLLRYETISIYESLKKRSIPLGFKGHYSSLVNIP